jgi:hypothetical protein
VTLSKMKSSSQERTKLLKVEMSGQASRVGTRGSFKVHEPGGRGGAYGVSSEVHGL